MENRKNYQDESIMETTWLLDLVSHGSLQCHCDAQVLLGATLYEAFQHGWQIGLAGPESQRGLVPV